MSFWMVANTKGRSWLEKWLAAGESPIASCEAFRAWVSGAFSHSLQAFVFLPTQGALHPFPVHHIASIRIARSYDGRIQSKNNIMHMYIYILYTSPSLSLYIYIHTYIRMTVIITCQMLHIQPENATPSVRTAAFKRPPMLWGYTPLWHVQYIP